MKAYYPKFWGKNRIRPRNFCPKIPPPSFGPTLIARGSFGVAAARPMHCVAPIHSAPLWAAFPLPNEHKCLGVTPVLPHILVFVGTGYFSNFEWRPIAAARRALVLCIDRAVGVLMRLGRCRCTWGYASPMKSEPLRNTQLANVVLLGRRRTLVTCPCMRSRLGRSGPLGMSLFVCFIFLPLLLLQPLVLQSLPAAVVWLECDINGRGRRKKESERRAAFKAKYADDIV